MVKINLPSITMTFLRPPPQAKPNCLYIETQKHMNKKDIKSYLCAVYNINPETITKIRTQVGSRKKINHPKAHILAELLDRNGLNARGIYRYQTIKKNAIIELDPTLCIQQGIDFKFPAPPIQHTVRAIERGRKLWQKTVGAQLNQGFVKEEDQKVDLVPELKNLSLSEDMVVGGSAKRRQKDHLKKQKIES